MHVYTCPDAFGGDRSIVPSPWPGVPEQARHMHPGPRRPELQHSGEHPRLVQESEPPLVVDCAGLAEVTSEVTLIYERRQHSLNEIAGVPIGHVFGIDESADQLLGDDGVRYTQSREEYLVEASNIDDTSARIDPLQRGDRAAFVSIVSVVIVLEDIGVGLACPGHQL